MFPDESDAKLIISENLKKVPEHLRNTHKIVNGEVVYSSGTRLEKGPEGKIVVVPVETAEVVEKERKHPVLVTGGNAYYDD